MLFTNNNVKENDIIKKKNGQLLFITKVSKDCIFYETEKSWKRGVIFFEVEGRLLTNSIDINNALIIKENATNGYKKEYQWLIGLFNNQVAV